jgi:hypothetical protein
MHDDDDAGIKNDDDNKKMIFDIRINNCILHVTTITEHATHIYDTNSYTKKYKQRSSNELNDKTFVGVGCVKLVVII